MSRVVREYRPTGGKTKLRPATQEHAFVLVRAKLYGCVCGQPFPGDKKRAKWHFDCHVAAIHDRAHELEQGHAFGDAGELWEFKP